MNHRHFLCRRGAIALALATIATSAVAQSPQDAPPPERQRRGPPIDKIAQDLDISPERVREAFRKVGPPPRGSDGPPTEQQMAAHTQKLADAMHVPVDQLRTVLEKYRPQRPPRQPKQQ